MLHQSRAHRIEVYVTVASEGVRLRSYEPGVKPSLPQRPGPILPRVQALGISLRNVLHQLRATGRPGRRKQEVNMVCHQAIGVDPAIELRRIFPQGAEVRVVIRFLEEAISAIVAPLHNMDSDVGYDQARRSRHVRETEEGM